VNLSYKQKAFFPLTYQLRGCSTALETVLLQLRWPGDVTVLGFLSDSSFLRTRGQCLQITILVFTRNGIEIW